MLWPFSSNGLFRLFFSIRFRAAAGPVAVTSCFFVFSSFGQIHGRVFRPGRSMCIVAPKIFSLVLCTAIREGEGSGEDSSMAIISSVCGAAGPGGTEVR